MGSRPPHRKRVRHYDEPGAFHELTFSCYRRMPLLTNNRWRAMLSEAITAALGRQAFRLVAFVYMPEHVHLLVYPVGPAAMVENLLRAIKRPFSFRIKQALEASRSPLLEKLTIRQRPGVTTFRFWQEGSFLARGARLRSKPDPAATGAGIDRLPSQQPGPPGTGGLGDLMAMVVGSQVC
jgi:REP element-mobilizing transposase RayT